ncbi:alpha/beta hydrolase [Bremerella cremea]|nr:alpha/beta fold hydrolase [Bremerella cremea]
MSVTWQIVIISAIAIIALAMTVRWLVRYILSGTYKAGEVVDPYRPRNFAVPDPQIIEFTGEKETTLRGRYWRGSSDQAIVVVHGIDGPSIEMLPHVAYLYRAGYHVLLYDNRGRGKSDGGFTTLGFLEWRDVLHAVKWMRKQPGIDSEKVGLHGLSLGAACVIMAAAEDQSICGVLAESPFVSMPLMLGHISNKITRLPTLLIGNVVRTILDWSLGTRLRLVEPYAAVQAISPRPLYIIDAEHDQLFPAETARTVYDAAGEPKQFWKVHGAAHANCWHVCPEEYEQRAIAFWELVFSENPPQVIYPRSADLGNSAHPTQVTNQSPANR